MPDEKNPAAFLEDRAAEVDKAVEADLRFRHLYWKDIVVLDENYNLWRIRGHALAAHRDTLHPGTVEAFLINGGEKAMLDRRTGIFTGDARRSPDVRTFKLLREVKGEEIVLVSGHREKIDYHQTIYNCEISDEIGRAHV